MKRPDSGKRRPADSPSRNTLVNHGRPLPPVATRWRKGTSGNPKGRPRKQETISQLVGNYLNEVCAGDAGKRTFAEILVKTLLQAALKGDPRACKLIWERHDGKLPPGTSNKSSISWEDLTPQERKNYSRRMVRIMDEIYGLTPRDDDQSVVESPQARMVTEAAPHEEGT